MSSKLRKTAALDWILLSIFFSIVLVGWLMLYAVSYQGDGGFWFDFNSIIGRQTIWLGVACICFIIFISLDWRTWSTLSFPIYILVVLLLLLVLLFGQEIKGARSWFYLMGYSFQPSEFAKIGTALALSSFLGQQNQNVNEVKSAVISFSIFLLPTILILLQPDAGTAIIFLAFMIPLFRAGLNPILYILVFSLAFIFIGTMIWSPYSMLLVILLLSYASMIYNRKSLNQVSAPILLVLSLFVVASYKFLDYRYLLLCTLCAGFYFAFTLYKEAKYKQLIVTFVFTLFSIALSFGTSWTFDNVLKPHQQNRINDWLRPELSDPRGSLYNIIQSKTAIGSGGFSGKGFLDGTMTKLNYVPEQSTDFIFSILGEEQGFIGSASIIILMTVLLFRITIIAERSTLPFIRYFGYSVAGIFFFHYFINIGMTMGIMPVIGIPLPLMSKGGSSLLSFFIMIAILLKMDQAGRRV